MTTIDDLYERHLRTVYGFFMVKTMHRQTAEDLTSEVFLRTLEQLTNAAASIQDPDKYLYGVMRLTWITYLRAKYAQPVTHIENLEDFAQYAAETIDVFLNQQLAERAEPFIAALPEKQRLVLTKRLLEGYSLQEIAGALGKDINYVKTTQRRGLAALRRAVAAASEGAQS